MYVLFGKTLAFVCFLSVGVTQRVGDCLALVVLRACVRLHDCIHPINRLINQLLRKVSRFLLGNTLAYHACVCGRALSLF